MEITFWLCLMTLIVFAVFGGMAYALLRMNQAFSSRSHLDELHARYGVAPRPGPFPGAPVWNGLRLGGRDWIRNVRIQVDARGLYLGFHLPLRQLGLRPPLALLLPWEHIHPRAEVRFKSMPARMLEVGDPAVTTLVVFAEVYAHMLPFLNEETNVDEEADGFLDETPSAS